MLRPLPCCLVFPKNVSIAVFSTLTPPQLPALPRGRYAAEPAPRDHFRLPGLLAAIASTSGRIHCELSQFTYCRYSRAALFNTLVKPETFSDQWHVRLLSRGEESKLLQPFEDLRPDKRQNLVNSCRRIEHPSRVFPPRDVPSSLLSRARQVSQEQDRWKRGAIFPMLVPPASTSQ